MKRSLVLMLLIALNLFASSVCVLAAEDDNPTVEPVKLPEDEGRVLLKANVHPSIRDLEETIYVELISPNGYEDVIYIEAINNYEKLVMLPIGDYVFFHAGVINDYKNAYPVESVTFTVEKDKFQNIEFNVGDPNAESHFDKKSDTNTDESIDDEDKISNDFTIVETESAVENRETANVKEDDSNRLNLKGFVTNNLFTIIALPLLAIVLFVLKTIRESRESE